MNHSIINYAPDSDVVVINFLDQSGNTQVASITISRSEFGDTHISIVSDGGRYIERGILGQEFVKQVVY